MCVRGRGRDTHTHPPPSYLCAWAWACARARASVCACHCPAQLNNTPVHYAANRHDLKMLKVLLDSNANINAQNNVSPVSPA